MTMPTMMNCPHQGDGWCLKCVQELDAQREKAEAACEQLRDFGRALDDLYDEYTSAACYEGTERQHERYAAAKQKVEAFGYILYDDDPGQPLLGELARLREIVAKLPKTADGVPVVTDSAAAGEGCTFEPLFWIDCGSVQMTFAPAGSVSGGVGACYSTAAAAREAAKGLK